MLDWPCTKPLSVLLGLILNAFCTHREIWISSKVDMFAARPLNLQAILCSLTFPSAHNPSASSSNPLWHHSAYTQQIVRSEPLSCRRSKRTWKTQKKTDIWNKNCSDRSSETEALCSGVYFPLSSAKVSVLDLVLPISGCRSMPFARVETTFAQKNENLSGSVSELVQNVAEFSILCFKFHERNENLTAPLEPVPKLLLLLQHNIMNCYS